MTVSVVRIGNSKSDSKDSEKLKAALVDYFNNKQQDIYANDDKKSKEVDDNVIRISNRYFHAFICLEAVEGRHDIEEAIEDGMMLVFPVSSSSSFNFLNSIHENAEADGCCGDTLRLCVGVSYNSVAALPISEKEYSRRVLWCLDNGYEYVEANISAEGVIMGHDDREKEGFARIIEAFEGTVWSSAKRLTKPKDEINKIIDNSPQGTPQPQPKTNISYIPPPSDDHDIVASLVTDSPANELYAQDIEDKEDAMLDNFEDLVREANALRERAKEGAVSDEERRERAADTALKIMQLLNLDDDDDDELEL